MITLYTYCQRGTKPWRDEILSRGSHKELSSKAEPWSPKSKKSQICRNHSHNSLECWVYRIHKMKVSLISWFSYSTFIRACLYFVEKVSEFWFLSLRFVGADRTGQGFIIAEAVAVLKPSVTDAGKWIAKTFKKHLLKWNIIAARALSAGNVQVNICLLWLSKCKPSCCPENLHLTAWEENLSLFTFWFSLYFSNEYFNSFISFFFVLRLCILWKISTSLWEGLGFFKKTFLCALSPSFLRCFQFNPFS